MRIGWRGCFSCLATIAWMCFAAIIPADANTIYALNVTETNSPGVPHSVFGFIITDDTLGALNPINITQWRITQTQGGGNLTDVFDSLNNNSFETNALTESLTATADGLLIGFARFHRTTIFGHDSFAELTASATDIAVFGSQFGAPYTFTAQGTIAVPGPVAGAGLPGLILAGGGLLGWLRRPKGARAIAA